MPTNMNIVTYMCSLQANTPVRIASWLKALVQPREVGPHMKSRQI